jgi:hypothetical protein
MRTRLPTYLSTTPTCGDLATCCTSDGLLFLIYTPLHRRCQLVERQEIATGPLCLTAITKDCTKGCQEVGCRHRNQTGDDAVH